MNKKHLYLPTDSQGDIPDPQPQKEPQGRFPCPCCGCITFPAPPSQAPAYICPVCFWENDLFLSGEEEPSDQNHGITLRQARENYRQTGTCDPRLLPYVRKPLPGELPR